MKKIFCALSLLAVFTIIASFHSSIPAASLNGAWKQDVSPETVVIIQDGYYMLTLFDRAGKKFIRSEGGTIRLEGNKIVLGVEFETAESSRIGQEEQYDATVSENEVKVIVGGSEQVWKKVDNGSGSLAGNWRITGRMQQDKLVPMNPGARKTLKILSGTRFQWAAINPETKEFFGTGGGTYTFKDGKYTENIEFFSRDSSRVGASLTFDGKVQGKEWQHSGLSSRGEKIHEVWTRQSK